MVRFKVTGAKSACVSCSRVVSLRLKGNRDVVAAVLGSDSSQNDSAGEDQWLVGTAAELPSCRILDADHGEDH